MEVKCKWNTETEGCELKKVLDCDSTEVNVDTAGKCICKDDVDAMEKCENFEFDETQVSEHRFAPNPIPVEFDSEDIEEESMRDDYLCCFDDEGFIGGLGGLGC